MIRVFLSVALLFLMVIYAQSLCRTIRRKMMPGNCVSLVDCKEIAHKIQEITGPLPSDFKTSIAARHCGFNNKEHYICCTDEEITHLYKVKEEFGDEYINFEDHENYNLLPTKEGECGQHSSDRVSNGMNAALLEIPWMAILQYETSDGVQGRCGGSLINNRYVLTAAHCVTDSVDPLVSVRLGEYDTSTEEDCSYFQKRRSHCIPPTEDYEVEKYVLHPKYTNFFNDIALIRLSEEVSLKNKTHIHPVCLPLLPDIQNSAVEHFTISGWGLTEGGQQSTILQKGNIPLKENSVCSKAFSRQINLTDIHLCAGGDNGIDSCFGDSGGPLFADVKLNTLTTYQFGIVSSGKSICDGIPNGTPGIYTRVTKYLNWILDNIEP